MITLSAAHVNALKVASKVSKSKIAQYACWPMMYDIMSLNRYFFYNVRMLVIFGAVHGAEASERFVTST